MNKIHSVYSTLLSSYGPQGWWPLTPKYSTKTKHHAGRPRNETHRFEIMLGAILTQNTAWTNVEKALEQLHLAKLVSVDRMKTAKQDKVAKLIRSAGYFNQKSERLIILSRFVDSSGIVALKKKDAKSLRAEFLGVKGIGPETADSIVLYAFEKPTFVIDAYTKRIFSRFGLCSIDVDYHELQAMFEGALPCDVDVYKEYHALIVEHAKRHCRTKPECGGCVLSKSCAKKF
ncbi:endonuclease [Candidatus Woesearchaeota archaeon]|nr:endonuclease [Candidatus Woesearchaeota archaeon]